MRAGALEVRGKKKRKRKIHKVRKKKGIEQRKEEGKKGLNDRILFH
jgi:hypothetical protein